MCAGKFRRAVLMGLLAATVMASPARAALLYYVQIPTIVGESTAPNHEGWITAFAFSAGMANPGTVGPGGVTSGVPSLSSVNVLKLLDKTSPKIALAVAVGTHIGNVTMEVVDSVSGLPIYHILLRNAVLTSSEMSGSSELPVESISIEFEAIEWTYTNNQSGDSLAYWDRITVMGGPGPLPTPPPVVQQDSDGDGIPDAYEMANGLNPLLNDANGDLDGDGASNINEYRAGTLANDARSVFRVRGVSQANGTIQITWSSKGDKTYTIRKGPTPLGGWTNVQTSVPAFEGETTRDVPRDAATLFYQVTTP